MNVFPAEPPVGGTPRPWNFPQTVVQDLANGLRVAAVRVGSLPIAQVRWVFGAGRSLESSGRIGSGLLLQRVMRHGTQTLGSRDFANTLDRLGARMGGGVSIDTSVVSIAGLSNHVWHVADLVSDVALRPGLSDLALAGEKIRSQQVHRHACSRTESIVDMALARALYGAHPYGTPASTESGLGATSRADLVALHGAIVEPARGMVLVVGDVDPDRVVRRLSARFADLPASETPRPDVPCAPADPERRLLFVEHPTAEQASLGVGLPAVPRNHPEHTRLRIANQVLGGGASSRLFQVLREQRGLTYGVYSALDCGLHAGDITATLAVAPEKTVPAFTALVGEFARISEQPVEAAEVQHAKRLLMGGFPQRASGLTGVASLTTAAWLHDLPEDVWSTIVPRIDAVTAAEVQETAARWLAPVRATAVVCGPKRCIAGLADAAGAAGMRFEQQSLDEFLVSVG